MATSTTPLGMSPPSTATSTTPLGMSLSSTIPSSTTPLGMSFSSTTPLGTHHEEYINAISTGLRITKHGLFGPDDSSQDTSSTLSDDFDDESLYCLPCSSKPPEDLPFLSPTSLNASYRALNSISEAHTTLSAVVDTGATRTCLANENEFDSLVKQDYKYELKGIAAGLKIKGEGIAKYDVIDDQGQIIMTLKLRTFYTPDLPNGTRLVPPQNLCTVDGLRGGVDTPGNEDDDGNIDTSAFATLYTFNPDQGYNHRIAEHKLRYNPTNNLPILPLRLPEPSKATAHALNASIELTTKSNTNLTNYQKELLAWHYKLGHVGFHQLKWMARMGKIPSRNQKRIANADSPICASCQFGKQTRRPVHNPKNKSLQAQVLQPTCDYHSLKAGDLLPGQRVSVDHYVSSVPGRLYKSRGGTRDANMYHGGAIFVDHASGFISVRHQVSLN